MQRLSGLTEGLRVPGPKEVELLVGGWRLGRESGVGQVERAGHVRVFRDDVLPRAHRTRSA